MESDNSTVHDMEIYYSIRNYIRKKINNGDNSFIGETYSSERAQILELIRRSVETGESNSSIVCGPPGCGKTALVNNVLHELRTNGIVTDENAAIVRLNGLLHTDDNLTLQDMTRQMKLSEFTEEAKASKSFQENLTYILEQLKLKNAAQPCVIFILDEFHLFTEHKNQLLLYNLFDTAQSAKSPICVIGLTYYSDVMDLLEKRVHSRFSHRVIQMAKNVNVKSRLDTMKEIFILSSDDLPDVDEIYKFVWNSRMEELLENKSVVNAIQQHLDLDPGETRFRSLLFQLFNSISFEEPLLSAQNVVDVFTPQDAHALILSKLSALEVALVVAVKHFTINYEREPFNFEMILAQYLKLLKQEASTMIRERAVVLKAFQRLQELEVVVPLRRGTSNALGKIPLEYQMYTFALTEEQVSEGVKLNQSLSTELSQWALNPDPT